MPKASNIYSQHKPNPSAYACNSIPVQGSIIGFSLLKNKCDNLPPEYKIAVSAAVSANAQTASMYIATVNGATSASGDVVVLSKGTILYFGASSAPTNRVVVNTDTVLTAITSGSPQAVSIDPAPAVASTETALTWGLIRLPSWQDLSLNETDGTADATEGESFYESQSATSKSVQIPLVYKLRDDLLAHQKVLHLLANEPFRNGFLALLRNGFPVIGGTFKAMNRQRGGAMKSQSMVNLSLMMQSDLFFPPYRSEMASGSADITTYDAFLQMAGFPS